MSVFINKEEKREKRKREREEKRQVVWNVKEGKVGDKKKKSC